MQLEDTAHLVPHFPALWSQRCPYPRPRRWGHLVQHFSMPRSTQGLCVRTHPRGHHPTQHGKVLQMLI